MNLAHRYIRALKYHLWYLANRGRFGQLGKGSMIRKPLRIHGPGNIFIGSNVAIGDLSWLGALPIRKDGSAELRIGNGCAIGNFNHIYATGSIVFGEKVLTADKVYISDNQHGYQDISMAVIDQPIIQRRHVHIGAGSWIGENVCILGASIGKHCVVGANAVVTRDIPDYCVAVGNPARIIRKYDDETGRWEPVSGEQTK